MDPSSANPQVMVRGGGRGQNLLMVDGQTMVDNTSNRAMFNMVNLSAVKEISVTKSGFNAEYGNVRSGVVNVITKTGSKEEYNGSLSLRYTPAHRKHRGKSIFDPENYFLKPYLDPEVAFEGTSEWPKEMQNKYPSFQGWNSLAEGKEATPKQLQKLFMWNHRVKGVDKLDPSREPGSYGDIPDYNIDASFGGPVPFVSDALGNLRFFASHKTHKDAFALPTIRDYYGEQNSQLKLTADITNNLTITLQGMYGETNTTTMHPRGAGLDQYLASGEAILNSSIATGYDYVLGQNSALYYPQALNPYDIYSDMVGISVEHMLSKNTWYNLRINRTHTNNVATSTGRPRNTETIGSFGPIKVDETPLGYVRELTTMQDGMTSGGEGATRDNGESYSYNVQFDLTSQIDKYNQIKAGFDFTYDDIYLEYGYHLPGDVGNNWMAQADRQPYRFGAYIQDKFEWKGMIANVGVRADYQNPNAPTYIQEDPYSKWFTPANLDQMEEKAPSESADQKLNISPRLGISHPISANAKLYFNYGHFYSMPTSIEMFVKQKSATNELQYLGNPNLRMPKTIAYELGTEYSLLNMFMIRLAGYYKDISNQMSETMYTNFTGTADYTTWENRNYQDIRGFEFRLAKRTGKWITGWINYDYMLVTSGYYGREHYFQDPVAQRQYGLTNPYQEKPLPQPRFNANIAITSPKNFGPEMSGRNPLGGLRLSFMYNWQAGDYFTYKSQEDNNVQWTPLVNADLRLSKNVRFGDDYSLNLYVDVNNVFDFKRLDHQSAFATVDDYESYMESLHLPMYEDVDNLKAGDDKPGMIKSDDKSYIDMPNRHFLTYTNPRSVTIGVGLNF